MNKEEIKFVKVFIFSAIILTFVLIYGVHYFFFIPINHQGSEEYTSAIGNEVLYNGNASGSFNTAIGHSALYPSANQSENDSSSIRINNISSLDNGFKFATYNTSKTIYLATLQMQKIPMTMTFQLNNTIIMELYENGTIWIKEGMENESAKQLLKVKEAYAHYSKQDCQEMLKP